MEAHLEEGDEEFLDGHVLEATLAGTLKRRPARHRDDNCDALGRPLSVSRRCSEREKLRREAKRGQRWGLTIVRTLAEQLALATAGTADRVEGRTDEAGHVWL